MIPSWWQYCYHAHSASCHSLLDATSLHNLPATALIDRAAGQNFSELQVCTQTKSVSGPKRSTAGTLVSLLSLLILLCHFFQTPFVLVIFTLLICVSLVLALPRQVKLLVPALIQRNEQVSTPISAVDGQPCFPHIVLRLKSLVQLVRSRRLPTTLTSSFPAVSRDWSREAACQGGAKLQCSTGAR